MVCGGACRWQAPESLRELRFDEVSDSFSLGATLFEVLSGGEDPLAGMSGEELLGLLRSRRPFPRLEAGRLRPSGTGDIVTELTAGEREQRMSVGEAAGRLRDMLLGKDRWEFPAEKLQLVRNLGSGQFGSVDQMIAEDMPRRGQRLLVAVKTLKLSGESSEAEVEAAKGEFLSEMRVMKRLNHPNLTGLLGVCTAAWPFRMILTFEANGSLEDWLQTAQGRASSDQQRLFFCHQVLSFVLFFAFCFVGDGAADADCVWAACAAQHRDCAPGPCVPQLPCGRGRDDQGVGLWAVAGD